MTTPSALHSKKKTDWGTPVEVVEGARKVMRSIDYDLCSSAYWNAHTVQAKAYWSADNSALTEESQRQMSVGNYLCNPPGGLVVEFWDLCLWLVERGSTVFWVGFSVEQLAFLQDRALFSTAFMRTIPRRRLKFLERRGWSMARPPVAAARPSHSNFLVLMLPDNTPIDKMRGDLVHEFHELSHSLGGVVF